MSRKIALPLLEVAASVAVPESWTVASAAIVAHLAQPQLSKLLVRAAALLVSFEFNAVFVYRGKAKPLHVYDNLPSHVSRAGPLNYTQSTYVLNPFYAAYLTGLKSGAYRMRDVVPDGFFNEETHANPQVRRTAEEEIGYVTEGWPEGCEELCIALTLTGGECAEISLLQQSARGV